MTRISVDLEPTRDPRTWRIVAHFRCDLCGWVTTTARSNSSGRPMRLRPRRPMNREGPLEHECEACAASAGR